MHDEIGQMSTNKLHNKKVERLDIRYKRQVACLMYRHCSSSDYPTLDELDDAQSYITFFIPAHTYMNIEQCPLDSKQPYSISMRSWNISMISHYDISPRSWWSSSNCDVLMRELCYYTPNSTHKETIKRHSATVNVNVHVLYL